MLELNEITLSSIWKQKNQYNIELKTNPPKIADSTTTYSTLTMNQMDDSIVQQDQPDSSSEIPMFTLIPPDSQSGSSSQVTIKNDTNNNNDRNNNNGKSKLGNLGKMSDDDDGNNNHQKRHSLTLNNLQRYQLDHGADSPHHPSSSVHHHHLLLLQQQQQMSHQQMSHLDKQVAGNLIPAPDNSPSLIVLQPSGQGGSSTYSPFFNHYTTGK